MTLIYEIELCGEPDDNYERRWMVPPPAKGQTFHIVRSVWSQDERVCEIWEWA